MRLYLDSADVDAVRRLSPWGAFAGVTTNPVLLAGAELSPEEAASRLGDAQPGDVFVQPLENEADILEERIRALTEVLPSRLMFKLPPTEAGLEVMARLRDERIWTAATALFTVGQGILAANAGADVLIPFWGRISESGGDAHAVVRDLVSLCERRSGRPRVLVASVKSQEDVETVARLGAWGATVPVSLAEEMRRSPGTEATLQRFRAAAGDIEE